MTGERYVFQCLTHLHSGTVTFDGNQKGKVVGVRKININPYPPIDKVLFSKGLKHNLFSISQLCDNGLDVSFNREGCIIQHKNGTQLRGNVILIR